MLCPVYLFSKEEKEDGFHVKIFAVSRTLLQYSSRLHIQCRNKEKA